MLVGVMINEAKCRRPGEIRTGRPTMSHYNPARRADWRATGFTAHLLYTV